MHLTDMQVENSCYNYRGVYSTGVCKEAANSCLATGWHCTPYQDIEHRGRWLPYPEDVFIKMCYCYDLDPFKCRPLGPPR